MKTMRVPIARGAWVIMLLLLLAAPSTSPLAADSASVDAALFANARLWYDRPAANWEEALPVGNGRLGAMVFGGAAEERIQLNEDTIWAGPPVSVAREEAAEGVAQVRELLLNDKLAEADAVLSARVLGERITPRSYQPLGDLWLRFDDVSTTPAEYRRELDLDSAIATAEGEGFRREVFASAVDDVIVVRLTAAEGITLTLGLTRESGAATRATADGTLVIEGQAAHGEKHKGVRFAGIVKVLAEGGRVTAAGDTLRVEGAGAVTLLIASATDYNAADPGRPLTRDRIEACNATLAKAAAKPCETLRADHVADHRRLFRRAGIDLGGAAAAELPTDERLHAVAAGASDPDLAALYFQFARYLLIASSRPGTMPANLQGLWNDRMEAPWNSDYHININLQMNYWPAGPGNLDECALPFFDYAERLLPSGRETARKVYQLDGMVAHHTSDAWLWTAPIGKPQWGMYPFGAAWLSAHFMEHYRFTGDRAFLKERAWPFMSECARFMLGYLVEDPAGKGLLTGPSNSPENRFFGPKDEELAVDIGTAMGQEIAWELFTNLIEAAAVLGIDDEFVRQVAEARGRLAPPGIGDDGRLMEWRRPYREVEPGHRHMSHLYGLYPGFQFTEATSPEMVAAARRSLESRLAQGGGHVGWSRAWIVSFYARLREGEAAAEHLTALIGKSSQPNLFDSYPPFQIDGNFGGAAGIAEMLLQSHQGWVELLPALPGEGAEGRAAGLRARGGWTVDMQWSGGVLREATVTADRAGQCRLRWQGRETTLTLAAGERRSWRP